MARVSGAYYKGTGPWAKGFCEASYHGQISSKRAVQHRGPLLELTNWQPVSLCAPLPSARPAVVQRPQLQQHQLTWLRRPSTISSLLMLLDLSLSKLVNRSLHTGLGCVPVAATRGGVEKSNLMSTEWLPPQNSCRPTEQFVGLPCLCRAGQDSCYTLLR